MVKLKLLELKLDEDPITNRINNLVADLLVTEKDYTQDVLLAVISFLKQCEEEENLTACVDKLEEALFWYTKFANTE